MKTELQLYSREMAALQKLADQLLRAQFRSAKDIWKLQTDLITYQVAIHDKIERERAAQQELSKEIDATTRQRARGWKARTQRLQRDHGAQLGRINIYRYARTMSRRLGDALAWMLLENDTQKILPLTENEPVPAPSNGVGLKGMLAVAQHLAESGLGFPIVHDVTSALRIGDLTFVGGTDDPLTLEVKTRIIDEKEGTLTLLVNTIGAGDSPRWKMMQTELPYLPSAPQESVIEDDKSLAVEIRPSRQLARQLQRMRKARSLQAAVPGEPVNIDDRNHVTLPYIIDDESSHWRVMRELLINARTHGYASQVVDDAILYAAMYVDTPIVFSESHADYMPLLDNVKRDLMASSILFQDTKKIHLNYLQVFSSLEYAHDSLPAQIRPFFLYPIPVDLVIDIMWGRLVFHVLINLGKFVERVEQVGLTARLPKNEWERMRFFLPVSKRTRLADGTEGDLVLAGLYYVAAQMGYECLSADGFVQVLSHMAEITADTLKPQRAAEDASTGLS